MAVLRPRTAPTIADYAVIGDCHSAALVSREGFVDWLCLPTFEHASFFAGILDRERGGHFVVRPTGAFASERAYLPDTNVLSTTFRTSEGTVVLQDCMPVCTDREAKRELRADHELLRVVRCTRGQVELELEYRPRPDYGLALPRIDPRGRLRFVSTHGESALIFVTEVDVAPSENGATLGARFVLRAGESRAFALAFSHCEPAVFPVLGSAAERRLAQCTDFWHRWIATCSYRGPYRDAVARSLLAVRLLIYAPSGGIVAAATTSLPEQIGGTRNWDYRYCWLRDASITMEALLASGYEREAAAFVEWVLHTTRLAWPELQPLYNVMGHRKIGERVLEHLAGFRGSTPVRVGNDAWRQKQLDSYGELIDATYRYAQHQHPFDRGTRRRLRSLAKYVQEHWKDRDAGIWEVRAEGGAHFTFSKAMCWVALDRLVRLDEQAGIGVDRTALRRAMDAIREAIETRGFDEARGTYVTTLDGHDVDASLLLLSRYGYADPSSVRMRGTVASVRRELEHDGIVHRYRYERFRDGVGGEEGGFGGCSFWLVSALARQGDADEAERLFGLLLAHANDVGLYGEELDSETGEALGNFPQGFTHVGLIDAAFEIEKARGRMEKSPREAA